MALWLAIHEYYSKSGYEIQGDKANWGQVSTLDTFFVSFSGKPLLASLPPSLLHAPTINKTYVFSCGRLVMARCQELRPDPQGAQKQRNMNIVKFETVENSISEGIEE